MKNKLVIKWLLYVLMVIFLFVFFVFLILDISIFKKGYITSRFKKDNYYETIHENINKDFTNRLASINIGNEIIDNLVTIDMIKEDVSNYIKGFYEKSSYILHSTELVDELNLRINKYLTDNKIVIESREVITDTIDKMVDDYEKSVTSQYFLNNMPSNFHKYKGLSSPLIIISIFLTLIIYLILLFIFKVKPLGKVFMACSSLIILFEFILQNLVINFTSTNSYLTVIFKNIYNDILMKFLLVGILLFVSGLIFFIFEKLFKRE